MDRGSGIVVGGIIAAIGGAILGLSSCQRANNEQTARAIEVVEARYHNMLAKNPGCYAIEASRQDNDRYYLQCGGEVRVATQ